MQLIWFVFVAAGCYFDSFSTYEAYEDARPYTSHQSRHYSPQADRSVSSKASRVSQSHNSEMHGSGRPRNMCTKVKSDLEYLSSIPSESAKSDKLSLEAQQVYAELQDISSKLKVTVHFVNHQLLLLVGAKRRLAIPL